MTSVIHVVGHNAHHWPDAIGLLGVNGHAVNCVSVPGGDPDGVNGPIGKIGHTFHGDSAKHK